MDFQTEIKRLAKEYLPEIVAIRNFLHAHPELSFVEFETQKFVVNKISEILRYEISISDYHNFQVKTETFKLKSIAKTGLLLEIKGNNPEKKLVALRADLDALPITEKSDKNYCSKNVGIMHACGHDVHTASLLGTLKILWETKQNWEGTFRFLFQPGEEVLPGGATLMIAEGALENPIPDYIIGQHVFPELASGKFGFRKGVYMASTDEIYITVKGKGGHGAMPHQVIDPVLIAAHILTSLQQIVSRNAKPNVPTVLSFGKVIANGATNIIPDEVKLEGTFRTMDENWRKEAHQKISNLANQLAESMGGKCEVNIVKGYPVLENDFELTENAKLEAINLVGANQIIDLDIRMTAEDFAWYSQKIPACFYRLGTANFEKNITSPVHTATFDIDENALESGMAMMAWLAINDLKK